MRKVVVVMIMFAVLLAASVSFAITDELGSGTVEGVVTGPDGSALEGATVVVDENVKQARTNLRGYYRIVDVKVERRSISCKKEGYSACEEVVKVEPDKISRLNFSLKKLAPSGGTTASNTGTIKGVVYLSEEDYVSGANIVLDGGLKRRRTGGDGSYRIDGVRPGGHSLSCWKMGYPKLDEEVEVKAGETETVDFTLSEGTST